MNNTQKLGIDIAKFLAAITVIYIHVPLMLTYSENVNYWFMLLTRWAVPFFFISSAFFLFEKLNKSQEQEKSKVIFKYCKNIASIWVLWTVIYLVFDIVNLIFVRNIMPNNIGTILWYLKITLRAIIFDGISGHLWYLTATIISTLIVCFLKNKLSNKKVGIIVIALFIIGLVGNTYKFLIPTSLFGLYSKIIGIIISTRNGLFWAPLLVFIGSLLSDNKERISKIPKKTTTICFWVLIILMLGEAAIVKSLTESYENLDMWISMVPISICIFICFYNVNAKISSNNALAIRNMSLTIYLIHPMIIYITSAIAQIAGLPQLYDASAVYYVITLVCSVGIAWLKYFISLKNKVN